MGYIALMIIGVTLVWLPALLGSVPLESFTLFSHGSASAGVVVLVLLLRWVRIRGRGIR